MNGAVSDAGADYKDIEAQARRMRVGVHARACLEPWEWRKQQSYGN